jgi:GNAT superfamily N-acetyltransferase
MPDRRVEIGRVAPGAWEPKLRNQIEAIFWEASKYNVEPPPGPEHDAFRARWLDRYLQGGSDVVLLAVVDGEEVAGYLVGALEDPATQDRFDDLSYFRNEFRALTRRFPAHLHINVAPDLRNRGIGTQLIEAFAAEAARAGAAGMHVVTGRGMRNVRFYARCGFAERGSAHWNGREIVLLGRELSTRSGP